MNQKVVDKVRLLSFTVDALRFLQMNQYLQSYLLTSQMIDPGAPCPSDMGNLMDLNPILL